MSASPELRGADLARPALSTADAQALSGIVQRMCAARGLAPLDLVRMEEAIITLLVLGSNRAAQPYECIGEATAIPNWWPAPGGFWPEGVPKEASIAGLVRALEALGYEVTDHHGREPYRERVALLTRAPLGDGSADAPPMLLHVVRQHHDGLWAMRTAWTATFALALDELERCLRCTGPTIILRRWVRPGRRCE